MSKTLYPTLEDLKVDQYVKAQTATSNPPSCQPNCPPIQGAFPSQNQEGMAIAQPSTSPRQLSLYPNLTDYMGLDISSFSGGNGGQVALHPSSTTGSQVVAPVTSSNSGVLGLKRAEIKPGIRQLILCKDGNGKLGLVIRSINKGVFVAFVHANSPASLVGLRFGDQILEINDTLVAGWDTDKVMKFLKNAPADRISVAVRDRPFERAITLQKDSHGNIGFEFKDGKIINLVKDSSACRNGVLTDHNLMEVNGQNVIGLKDKDIVQIIKQSPQTTTVTVMPSFLYSHIIKCIGSGLIKKSMDHSIPEI